MEAISKLNINFKDKILFYICTIIVFSGTLVLTLFLLGIGHSIPLKFTTPYLAWIYMELVLVFFACLVDLAMIKRSLERKNALTRNVVWLFLMYTAGMALTSYSKLIKYIIDYPIYASDSYMYHILYNFRFASFFSAFAGLFFYRFYVDVFVQKK